MLKQRCLMFTHGMQPAMLCSAALCKHNNGIVFSQNKITNPTTLLWPWKKEKNMAMCGCRGCVCSHSREGNFLYFKRLWIYWERVKWQIGCHIKEWYDWKGGTKPQLPARYNIHLPSGGGEIPFLEGGVSGRERGELQ